MVMEKRNVDELKNFVEYCKQNPSILRSSNLSFFRDFLQSLGARIPESGASGRADDGDQGAKPCACGTPDLSRDDKSVEEIVESDVELDDADVVEPDNDPPQRMGNLSDEETEEKQEAAQLLKGKAVDMMVDGKFDDAINCLTEAILLNPKSAILYANRASIFIKLKKPNAAIRDADFALKLNNDSAKGYKTRGMARAMLGLWEAAASDLHLASKLDFDEEISLVLRKVEPNAKKIEEHRRKYERLRKQKEQEKIRIEKEKQQAKLNAEKAEDAASFIDGEVIGIHSARDLKAKLNAASKASRLAVIYFTAKWCGPCRYISPEYSNLAKKYPKVVFLKVDIDEANDAAAERNISSVPTFFFIKNGNEVDQVVGADKTKLEMKVAQHSR